MHQGDAAVGPQDDLEAVAGPAAIPTVSFSATSPALTAIA